MGARRLLLSLCLILPPFLEAHVLICSLTDKEFPKLIINGKKSNVIQLNEKKSCPLSILQAESSLEAQAPMQSLRVRDDNECLGEFSTLAAYEFSILVSGFSLQDFPEKIEVIWGLDGRSSLCSKKGYKWRSFNERFTLR